MKINIENLEKSIKNIEPSITVKDIALVVDDLKKINRGTAEIISVEELALKLIKSKKNGIPLKIKLGIDPTAPHVHLGFAVVLRKLRTFQDLGHRVQLVIGDFTARVGDPTGKSETRKMLTPVQIEENAKNYKEQLSIILEPKKTDVSFNSHWLLPLNFSDILSLTSKYTVARIMERDDFSNRFKSGRPLGMHEILYPLMQGYDSVVLKSDVEMGGTDQKFNNLVGRDLQKEFNVEPQVVILMPILEGTDGVLKMSKSYGNYIGITDPPKDMFGKVMSIPDNLIIRYFELCTDVPMDEVIKIKEDIEKNLVNPRDVKMRLGREIIKIYHNDEKAKEAQEEFLRVFSRKELPSNIKEIEISSDKAPDSKVNVVNLIVELKMASSKREARRLVIGGAVRVNGDKIENPTEQVHIDKEKVIQVGSRKFAKVFVKA